MEGEADQNGFAHWPWRARIRGAGPLIRGRHWVEAPHGGGLPNVEGRRTEAEIAHTLKHRNRVADYNRVHDGGQVHDARADKGVGRRTLISRSL